MDAIYNDKAFLLPHSPDTMACYHAKIQGQTMKLTIHDCRTSVQLWNDLTTPKGVADAVTKLSVLENGIRELREFIENRKQC